MNIDKIPESLKPLIPLYKEQDQELTEEKFKEFVKKIAAIKLRRKPSRSLIQWNDQETLSYVYSEANQNT